MFSAFTLVVVVSGVSVPPPQQIDQQIVPAVAPASTTGPCASIAIGITDDWCTDTCTQGDGAYCNTASCVCGEEAEAELAKPDRAINTAPVAATPAPAPVAVPVAPDPVEAARAAGTCDPRFLPTCIPMDTEHQQQQQPADSAAPVAQPAVVPSDPRADAGIQPLQPATTAAPVPTPISTDFPTENVCNFDVIACINTTTDEMVPCLGWEDSHPEASPSPTGKGDADPAARWSAHNARLRRSEVRPARPPLDPRALCDEKTGKPTNGSTADCRSCEHHIKWCYESSHFDEDGKGIQMTLEDCMDYVADEAQECGPAGCRYACSMCSTKESKMKYKGLLGLPMNEPAPISSVSTAAEIKNNQDEATDNAKRKAEAEAAQAARAAQEATTTASSQAAAAAEASGSATEAAGSAATEAAEAAAAEAAAAEAAAEEAAKVATADSGGAPTTVSAAPAAPSAPPTLTAEEMAEAAQKASERAAAQAEKAVRDATKEATAAAKAAGAAAESAGDGAKLSNLAGMPRLNRAASVGEQPSWDLMGPNAK